VNELKLTQKTAERAGIRDQRYWMTDDLVKGLRLIVSPTGQKTWQIRYRLGRGGVERLGTLGQLHELSHEDARDKAIAVKQAAKRGKDLLEEETPMEAVTVAGLWEEYLKEVGKHWSPATRALNAGRVEDGVRVAKGVADIFLAAFGKRPAAGLSRKLVVEMLHDNEHRKTMANKAVQLLRQLYRWARDTRRVPLDSDPTVRLKLYEVDDEVGKEYSDEELALIGGALQELSLEWQDFYYLLATTGCRPGELCSLRKDQVDFFRRVIVLQKNKHSVKTKTRKSRVLPLDEQGVEILRRRCAGAGPWVFPADSETGYMPSSSYLWAWGKVREKTKVEGRPYDLRHTFVTRAAAESLSAAQALAGHASIKMTERYIHHGDEPLRRVAGTVGAGVSGALAGEVM
jgi:integrase